MHTIDEQLRHLILGTAGHIDHGKSALVRALTGTDPDRLKEEKRRGITIELGFADLELTLSRRLSFVDVPGHERFVRHMVAGATGIDAVLLVVAADQGVQPQTREHLDVCSLLGLQRGVVALSKCDLVDEELREVVALELQDLLSESFLAGAPVIPVSAKGGTGLDELRGALSALFDDIAPRPVDGVARLPVDRSFVLRGFGSVITGTLASGRLTEGDEVEILPGGKRGRIRGLQVHGSAVNVALAGQRTAVNLQGLDCDEVPRGATVTRPGDLLTTRRAHANLRLLPQAPERLNRGGEVRFHQGTCERAARYRVIDRSDSGELHIELYLEPEAVLAPGDRFIIRRPAPVDTIGGGVILDIRPTHRLRHATDFSPAAWRPDVALSQRLARAGVAGVDPASLAPELGLPRAALYAAAERADLAERIVKVAGRWVDSEAWEAMRARATEQVGAFHAEEPLRLGIAREALRARCGGELPQDLWRHLLASLESEGRLLLDGERVALAGHSVELGEADRQLAARIGESFDNGALNPPELDEIVEAAEADRAGRIVELLLAQGVLVRIQSGKLFAAAALEALRGKLRDHARSSKTIDVAAFKELAGITRKNAIPLLEQLDVERTTRRVGNLREILLG